MPAWKSRRKVLLGITGGISAYKGPDLLRALMKAGCEVEVVLTEERPVVEKETVPVERVRIGTETKTDTEQVSAEVRKEEIELEDDTHTDR